MAMETKSVIVAMVVGIIIGHKVIAGRRLTRGDLGTAGFKTYSGCPLR